MAKAEGLLMINNNQCSVRYLKHILPVARPMYKYSNPIQHVGRLLFSVHEHQEKHMAPETGWVKPPRWLSGKPRDLTRVLPANTLPDLYRIYVCEKINNLS